MPRLFGRARKVAPSPVPGVVVKVNWTRRLHAVGRALDAYGTPLRALAVATDGDQTLVAALGWRASLYHDAWVPLTLQVEGETAQPFGAAATIAADKPVAGERAAWALRLRAVGVLLDREPAALHDACVIEVDGGFVVQALTPSPTPLGAGWILVSKEFAVGDLAAAPAPASAMPNQSRPAGPWRQP